MHPFALVMLGVSRGIILRSLASRRSGRSGDRVPAFATVQAPPPIRYPQSYYRPLIFSPSKDFYVQRRHGRCITRLYQYKMENVPICLALPSTMCSGPQRGRTHRMLDLATRDTYSLAPEMLPSTLAVSEGG